MLRQSRWVEIPLLPAKRGPRGLGADRGKSVRPAMCEKGVHHELLGGVFVHGRDVSAMASTVRAARTNVSSCGKDELKFSVAVHHFFRLATPVTTKMKRNCLQVSDAAPDAYFRFQVQGRL